MYDDTPVLKKTMNNQQYESGNSSNMNRSTPVVALPPSPSIVQISDRIRIVVKRFNGQTWLHLNQVKNGKSASLTKTEFATLLKLKDALGNAVRFVEYEEQLNQSGQQSSIGQKRKINFNNQFPRKAAKITNDNVFEDGTSDCLTADRGGRKRRTDGNDFTRREEYVRHHRQQDNPIDVEENQFDEQEKEEIFI